MSSPFDEKDFEIYDKPDLIWATLESQDVAVVRSKWVIEQAHDAQVLQLPRRQDLLPEAFMPTSELKLLAKNGPRSE